MSALLEKAKQQYNRGDTRFALATLRRLIQQERRNADAHILAATIHEQQGDRLQAASFYADAIALTPALKREVAFRAASHFLDIGLGDKALAALVCLHRFMPEDVETNHSICSILREAGRYAEAAPFAVTLAAIGSSFGNALNAGIVLSGLGRYDEARPLLERAYGEQPTERLALSEYFWCAANLCDLPLVARLEEELKAGYAADGATPDIRENAFRALTWSGDEAYHAACARRTADVMFPRAAAPWTPPPRDPARRIRIGYVSSDFFDHATMALFAGVLEAHDRDRFEVFGFCHTAEASRSGPMRTRYLAAVEHHVDLLALDDDAAAALIRRMGIDILVDLKGFTQGNRLGIFCRRPAPVQITYLGYPGSVAGVGIDHALTDSVVTPASSEPHYAEHLLRLSQSYQCNDPMRLRPECGDRAKQGLPDTGIVFSAFHQAQKIRPQVFAAWMRILAEAEGAVLWLADQSEAVKANLRQAAADAGIDPSRLIFAGKKPLGEHLARLAHADIALDTAPYNGHTTTSDALWCAVPVVTWRGTSFASRVSESLLNAVGLPDLVAEDIDQFVRLAGELARDGDRLSILRQTLLTARDTAPLFDAVRLTREIEARFEGLCGV